jgi:integrase
MGARPSGRGRAGRRHFSHCGLHGSPHGELLALRWRDVDFTGSVVRVRASYYLGQLTTPKSGKVRAVPLAPAVATAFRDRRGTSWDVLGQEHQVRRVYVC